MLKVLKAYRRSLNFLFEEGLGWFLWFPLIITVLVFFGGFSLTSWATKYISDSLDLWLESVDILPDWLAFMQDVIYWIIWLVLRIILYFIFVFIGGSVILLMMSPILTWLSELVAVRLDRDVPPFDLMQFLRDLSRAIALALRNGLLQIALSIFCFILGLIPLVGAVAPFLLFTTNAYFFGYNFLDYSLERRRFSIQESNRYVWKNRVTTMSIGAPFALWMLVPLIGPMTSGFVAIFATVAATLELERREAPNETHETT